MEFKLVYEKVRCATCKHLVNDRCDLNNECLAKSVEKPYALWEPATAEAEIEDEANKILQEQLNSERMKNYELKQIIRKYQAKCEAYEHILRKIIKTAEGGAK